MRWTKEAEETLWQTIFKTQSFHLELDKISEAWPEDDKPTPKALKEHLQKYRKNLGGETSITFSLGSKKGGDSAPATPRKRGPAAKKANGGENGSESAPVTPKKRGTPRKASAAAQEMNEPVIKMEKDGMMGIGETTEEDEGDDSDGSPMKKVKMEVDKNEA